jgi:hypothetical protein
MVRQFLTLVVLMTMAATVVHAEDDLCVARPDLCDSSPHQIPVRRAPSQMVVHRTPCRMPGHAYDLDGPSLPVCKTVRTRRKASFDREVESVWQDVNGGHAPPLPTRRPSSFRTSSATDMSFESYMRTNSMNPAVAANRAPAQEAFKDYSKPAVITGSTLDAEPPKENTSANNAPTTTTATNANANAPTVGAPTLDGVGVSNAGNATASAAPVSPFSTMPSPTR